MNPQKLRKAEKAGSWYSSCPKSLKKELETHLENCKTHQQQVIPHFSSLKAIIAPHAGLSYCAKTGAFAYQYLINKNNDLNVFLIGPSHRYRMSRCGLTDFSEFETPLGNIKVNTEIVRELVKNNELFETLPADADLNEHSLELHLPWIKQMLQNSNFQLIPIMVGGIDKKQIQKCGQQLAPYFDKENSVFIISSDFCHWGQRFNYTYYKNEEKQQKNNNNQQQQQQTPIYQSIEILDKQAIQILEKQDQKQFQEYLEETGNTICGRRPIQILLEVIANSKNKDQTKTKFLSYDQSGQCIKQNDSSVSYASLITYI